MVEKGKAGYAGGGLFFAYACIGGEIGIKGLTAESVSGKLERREKSCRKVLKMPENKLNDEKVLRMFVDRLIADKGGDTFDVKQKETLEAELMEELDGRIQQAMIRALTDAKLMELEKLLDADAPDEEIEKFFENAGVDFDPAIRKAMDAFRTDYFKDKIRVSVKTSASVAAGAGAPASVAAGAGASVSTLAPAGAGVPAQGVTSAVPGQSNVEGVANAASAAAQGQTMAAKPEVVAQGTPVSGAPAAAAPVVATPVAEERPLQAAPDLMAALLNAATVSAEQAVPTLGQPATTVSQESTSVNAMTGTNAAQGVNAVTGVNGVTGVGEAMKNNAETTGKEA